MMNIAKQRGQTLIILFSALFLGGAASVTSFVQDASIKDVKTAVKKVVTDEMRKDEILSLLKEWEKKEKKSRKQIKDDQKSLMKVVSNYDSTRDMLEKATVKLNESIYSEDQTFLDLKFTMRQKLTKEEWDKLLVQMDK